jgi:hypothetical protein
MAAKGAMRGVLVAWVVVGAAGCGSNDGETASSGGSVADLKRPGKEWAGLSTTQKAKLVTICKPRAATAISSDVYSQENVDAKRVDNAKLRLRLDQYFDAPATQDEEIGRGCESVVRLLLPVHDLSAADPTTTPTGPSANESCESLGITPEQGKEGTCAASDGSMIAVVNKGSTLKLQDLKAKVVSVESTDTVSGDTGTATARGTFVVVRLAVTNNTDAPVRFDDSQDQVGLTIDGKQFSQDFETENGKLTDSWVWADADIQPTETTEGVSIFDVPAGVAKQLESPAAASNVIVISFQDKAAVDSGDTAELEGRIRLYR